MFARLVLFLSLCPVLTNAQESLYITIQSEKVQEPEIQYEDIEAGKLRVVVTDSGAPVGGLTRDDFAIRSDLSEYKIISVEPLTQTENAKVSIVLCIDNSQSMKRHVDILKETLDVLLASFGPSVKISTVFFQEGFAGTNDLGLRPVKNIRIYGLTRDKEAVRQQIVKHLENHALSTRTYLYDEVYAGIKVAELIQDDEENEYVIVLSDGLDNASGSGPGEIKTLAAANEDVAFYTIDYLTNPNDFLVELAQGSRGRHFRARKADELSAIFEDISQDIVTLSGYRITYEVPLAYLTGRVLAKDRCEPLTEAAIEFLPVQFQKLRKPLKVNEDGIYHSRLALPHTWRVVAGAPGYIPDSTEVEVSDESLYFADFTLSPAIVEIAGRVMDSGTAPLPAAQVTVTELESGDVIYEGETDSLGIYRVRSWVGRQLLVTATKEGYTFGTYELRSIRHNTIPEDIILGLTAEGRPSEFRFLFEFDSDKLDMNDISTQTQLKGCVDFIRRELGKSSTRMVRLVGWTDNVGDPDYNLNLSQRRASYVQRYLVEQDIPDDRIVALGKGISDKYDNATEAGRAQNRRTEVVFFDQQEEAVTEKQ